MQKMTPFIREASLKEYDGHRNYRMQVCCKTTANNVKDEEPLPHSLTRACNLGGETVIAGDLK